MATTSLPVPHLHCDTILYSFDEFKAWFLETYDLSIFAVADIDAFLAEESPEDFPCIPYFGDPHSHYPSDYIGITQIMQWSEIIDKNRMKRP